MNFVIYFRYLLSFVLSNFYLAKILFLQECGSFFWELFFYFRQIFNEQQYNL